MLRKSIVVVSIIVGLCLLLLCLPYLFKGKIIEISKQELNKALDADVDFADVNLTFFKSFPSLSLEMEAFTIVGRGEFAGDTLLNMPSLLCNIGIVKAFQGQLDVEELILNRPSIYVYVTEANKANYDIYISDTTSVAAESSDSEEPSSMTISLQSFLLEKANIRYVDKAQRVALEMEDFTLRLAGDFSAATSELLLSLDIPALSYSMDSSTYINRARFALESQLAADFNTSKYTLLENKLYLNQLACELKGWVQMHDDKVSMDLNMQALESSFAGVLDLLPADYLTYVEGVEAKGALQFGMQVQGDYSEHTLPRFELMLKAADASLQYPDLPQAIEGINIDIELMHPGGADMDLMVCNINAFDCRTAGSKVSSNWSVKHLLSDPQVKGAMKGKVLLHKLAESVPMEDMQMKGDLDFDFQAQGRLSSLEQERYTDFTFLASVLLKDFELKSSSFRQAFTISNADIKSTSKEVQLKNMQAKIGESDFNLKGSLSAYLPYLLEEGKTMRGRMEFRSNKLNMDELMDWYIDEETPGQTEAAGQPVEPMQIPAGLDFVLDTEIKQLQYGGVEALQAHGKVLLKDCKADLSKLKVTMLDGLVVMDGMYDTKNASKHRAQFAIDMADVSMAQTTLSFASVSKLAPILKQVKGLFSANLNYAGDLDAEMSPILESINCVGSLSSKGLSMDKSPLLDMIADKLGNKKFSSLKSKAFDLKFTVKDGKLEIPPFDCEINDMKITVWGAHGLNQDLDYFIRIPVNPSDLKAEYADKLKMINPNGTAIPLVLKIKGPMNKPSLDVDISEAKKLIEDQLKQKAKDKAGEKVGDLLNKFF